MLRSRKKHKILYIHGWESGPNGIKAKSLQKVFDVFGEEQSVGAFNMFKKNSIIRNLIKEQLLSIGAIVCSTIGSYYYLTRNKPNISNKSKYLYISSIPLLYFVSILFRRKELLNCALKTSLNSCIEIQKNCILKYKPDLIIGSSWGGCVTVELLKRNIWNKQTILLAPGYTTVYSYLYYNKNIKNALKLNLNLNKKVLIIHGNKDNKVSLNHSIELQKYNKNSIMDVKVIDGEDHNLHRIAKNGKLQQIVQEYIDS